MNKRRVQVLVQIDAVDREVNELAGLIALGEAHRAAVAHRLQNDRDTDPILVGGAHFLTLLERAHRDLSAEVDILKGALRISPEEMES